MSDSHRDAVLDLYPAAAAWKTRQLDSDDDIEYPSDSSDETYIRCAYRLQALIPMRLDPAGITSGFGLWIDSKVGQTAARASLLQ